VIKDIWNFLKALPANIAKLFTPLSFLRLKNRDLVLFQWVAPSITALLLYFFVFNPFSSNFTFHNGQLFEDINQLVGVLVGFYIAALAAVATFPNNTLDVALKGLPTTLRVKRANKATEETITRRRYLTIVFGYCAFVSIIVFIFGVFQNNVSIKRTALAHIYYDLNIMFFNIVLFVYFWAISSLFYATLVGLHYLVDRMHRK